MLEDLLNRLAGWIDMRNLGLYCVAAVADMVLVVVADGCSGESECRTCDCGEPGFLPSSLEIAQGDPGSTATLTFTRTTDDTCARWVAIPDVQRNVFLPLNKPVAVQVPTDEPRPLRFRCGTGVFTGTLMVR